MENEEVIECGKFAKLNKEQKNTLSDSLAEELANIVKNGRITSAQTQKHIANKQATLDQKEQESHWNNMLLEAQLELARETGKWSKRFDALEVSYKKKIKDLQEEMELHLEEGYAEAYEMLQEQITIVDSLRKEIKRLKGE